MPHIDVVLKAIESHKNDEDVPSIVAEALARFAEGREVDGQDITDLAAAVWSRLSADDRYNVRLFCNVFLQR